ncbi:MAG: 3,4-dehydroadipyl-CoA semialdehyde dehydrogenase [Sandaracinaceae bacterium]|nr:3,4-dehydroadipyl-CoA semialdehyde dehydrogenase [Sandaracinaceae bacterium]
MITLESYLRGEWVKGQGEGATLHDPTTGKPVATASSQGLDLVAAYEHARHAGGPALRRMSFAERGAMLKTLSAAIHDAREELIEASILNAGTTRSDAKFDIDGASGTLAYYASLGKKLGDARVLHEEPEQLTRSPRFFGVHVWTPITGVAVHVNAFNFPAWGLAEKAAVALLAGVPVISKPATATALLTYRMVQKMVAASVLPKGALQLVVGSLGDLLGRLGSQDAFAFTGSGATGTKLRGLANLLERSVRVNVEADSLNLAVLAPDAEPGGEAYAMFVRDVAKEITQKSGQKCTAIRRVLVPAAVIDRVQEDLCERLSSVKVGDPSRDDVTMGPLATAQQLADFRAGVSKLQASGARVVFGSATQCDPLGADANAGYFVGPVLLRADRPADAHAVHEHEVFGPCATILPYSSTAEAVELAARGGGGLVASVYGDDRALLSELVLGLAPHHGRVLVGSKKIVDQAIAPGLVLPSCVHGGPGRAGGGEELGGERGLRFYMQRTAVQGDRALLDKILGLEPKAAEA